MMEVIPINTNENTASKADLWADRIHTFRESGLSRKDWCQKNGIPQSTLSYWIRKIQSKDSETVCISDPVFAKLPSEQELQFNATTVNSPVAILLPDNVRIEVGADCPARLMTALLQACGVTDLRKSYTGLAAIIKLKFHLDPYSRCMFAFCNRRRTLIKILQWDGSGFWILMKRLDRNSFHWPDTPDELRKVTLKEIHWLCDGLSLNSSGAFEECHPKIVV